MSPSLDDLFQVLCKMYSQFLLIQHRFVELGAIWGDDPENMYFLAWTIHLEENHASFAEIESFLWDNWIEHLSTLNHSNETISNADMACLMKLAGASENSKLALQRLYDTKNIQEIVEGLLNYSIAQIVVDDTDFRESLSQVFSMWNPTLEMHLSSIEDVLKFGRLKDTVPVSLFSLENDNPAQSEEDARLKKLPINELSTVLFALIISKNYLDASQLLQNLSTRVSWRVIFKMVQDCTDIIEVMKSGNDDSFLFSNFIDTSLYLQVFNQLLDIVDDLDDQMFDGIVTSDIAYFINWLNRHDLKSFGDRLNKLSLATHSKQSLDLETGDNENVTELSYLDNKTFEEALSQNRFRFLLDQIDEHVEPNERIELRRAVVKKMAQAKVPEAASEFRTLMQEVQMLQSRSISMPRGETLKSVVFNEVSANPDKSLDSLLLVKSRKPQRHLDIVRCGAILAMLQLNRLSDAKSLLNQMSVDPWLTEARSALIFKLVEQGNIREADELILSTHGKINKLECICAFISAMGSSPSDAQTEKIRNASELIVNLQRAFHRVSAKLMYTTTLLSIQHPEADKALADTLTEIERNADMLTRFYAYLDLLDVLLQFDHPQSTDVLHITRETITEAKDTKINKGAFQNHDTLNDIFMSNAEWAWQSVWQSVFVGTLDWEISALLQFATILAKHDLLEDAQLAIGLAQDFLKQKDVYGWPNLSMDFASVSSPSAIKSTIESLGSRPLDEVMRIIISMESIFASQSADLPNKVTNEMLRIFSWVGYHPTDVERIIKPYIN